ncbi:hypothetical protein GY45DRAFT_1319505 [Cubamyces sp. BRFM 1775]|nr:hypothetical protein GY45DRAFT_1319505 [Cubamyces sp. BRFM 1775]
MGHCGASCPAWSYIPALCPLHPPSARLCSHSYIASRLSESVPLAFDGVAMFSLSVRRSPAHPGCKLEWSAVEANELALAAQHLSSADFVVKPNELHLAFDIGPLRSRNYSRFKRINPRHPTHTHTPGRSYHNPTMYPAKTAKGTSLRPAPPPLSRSSSSSSIATLTMALTADVGVLLTRHVRRESTYIVWGGVLAFEPRDGEQLNLPLRAVLVKIAVDDEGGEDLREHARHYEGLAERGLDVGYYGVFVDSIGSTALVVEDLGEDSPRPESP